MAWGFESPRPHQIKGRLMNRQYHNKGLGWAFLIVTILIVAVPWGITYAMVGHDDYARHCKMTPLLPCFGVGE